MDAAAAPASDPTRKRKRCPHGRMFTRCKDCGGGSICEHGRQRYNCKDCGGRAYCEHGRLRFCCKPCGGVSLCEHQRARRDCKDCRGSNFCEHERLRRFCKECGGSSICVHQRVRTCCKACGGGSICMHGRKRTYCKACGGSVFCEHGKRTVACKDCLPLEKRLASKRWCIACTEKLLSPQRVRVGVRLCAECNGENGARTEVIVRQLLTAAVPTPPSAADSDMLGGSGCGSGLRRPDLAWYGPDRAIFVEVDENGGHPDRAPACELGKLWDQTAAVKALQGESVRVFMLRLNPDVYDGGRCTLEDRVLTVAEKVKELLAATDLNEYDARVPHVGYYFYHSSCHFHIQAAMEKPDAVLVFHS